MNWVLFCNYYKSAISMLLLYLDNAERARKCFIIIIITTLIRYVHIAQKVFFLRESHSEQISALTSAWGGMGEECWSRNDYMHCPISSASADTCSVTKETNPCLLFQISLWSLESHKKINLQPILFFFSRNKEVHMRLEIYAPSQVPLKQIGIAGAQDIQER